MSVEHDEEDDWRRWWDDISGEQIDTDLIVAGKEDTLAIKSMSVDVKVPIAQCPAETGWPPVRTRWVDANRGDLYNPKVFSGLVTACLLAT